MIVPLIIGFVIAGVLIGFAARDAGFKPFLKMAISGVILGIAFTGIGLLVSTVSRTRVQALVCALLAWGAAVFAFDLAVLGVVVSTKSVQAAAEIDLMCDATHVNAQTDIHAAFEGGTAYKKELSPELKGFSGCGSILSMSSESPISPRLSRCHCRRPWRSDPRAAGLLCRCLRRRGVSR